MEDEQQTVADQTDTESQTSAEEGGAQDDLDTLLSQWNSSTNTEEKTEKSVSDSKGAEDTQEVVEWVREEMRKRSYEQTTRDLESAAQLMKQSLPEDSPLSEGLLKTLLQGRAAEDQRLVAAFQNRHQNKQGWERVLKATAREIAKEFSVDRATTDDRDAVASAVKSASKAPPPEEGPSEADLQKMSDREFFEMARRLR